MLFRRVVPLLIAVVAISVAVPAHAASRLRADEVPVFLCDFGAPYDLNYDTWPDGWQRHTDEQYPHYVDVAIVEDPMAVEGRALCIALDGASAQFSSPRIPVLPKFSYRLQFSLKVEAMQHSRVFVSIEMFDKRGKQLQTVGGEAYQNTDGWVVKQLEPFQPLDNDVAYAVIRVEALRGRRGDLQAKIYVDDIQLVRLPSMVVTTDSPLNVYDNPYDVAVTCSLSGIKERNPVIRFQLLDATQYVVDENDGDQRELPTRLITQDARSAHDIVGVAGSTTAGYEGSYTWRPPIQENGYYKIRVQMLSSDDSQQLTDEERELYRREISVVVLPPGLAKSKRGEFGWTMPLERWPLTREQVSQLAPMVGIHWLKSPVWFDAESPEEGEALIQFAERLAASEVEVVGIIEDPTVDHDNSQGADELSAISSLVLADKSVWQPLYDHVMARLSLRIRWWQLGSDGDYSLKDFPELPEKISDIRLGLFRFGQDAKLGLGWRWPLDHELAAAARVVESNPTWDFEQFVGKNPLSSSTLTAAMQSAPRSSALRWVNVELGPEFALPDADELDDEERQDEDLRRQFNEMLRRRHEERIREFVRQIIAAKRNAADGIFISDVFTGPFGVMNENGTPGELFLPWRTAASVLGGARYLGKLQLPGGSENHVFVREDGELVMVLWNDVETTERLYLGESLQQLDVWGNRTTPDSDGHRSSVRATRLPSYVLGLNSAVTRWRMAVQFETEFVPSIFAREHPNTLTLNNAFRQGTGGRVRIVVPRSQVQPGNIAFASSEKWRVYPEEADLRLAPGEEYILPFGVYLDEATFGDQPVRVDFELEADRQYVFSVWRTLHVGTGEISIEVKTRLDADGRLVVDQWMRNVGDRPSDFKCLLSAPPRRRKRAQVFMLGADGDKKEYIYEYGEQLIGQMITLRAEEINGQRVLIHRFTAER